MNPWNIIKIYIRNWNIITNSIIIIIIITITIIVIITIIILIINHLELMHGHLP